MRAKKSALFTTVILGFVLFSFALGPANVAGKWNMKMEGRNGEEITREFEITQDGESITIQMEGFRGGDMLEMEGTVSENEVNWEMTMETQRGEMTITYTAKVDGDKMEGEMSFGEMGGRPFTAERIK